MSDLVLEAALSTILDLEDSVAVVDADDKVLGLRQLARHPEGHADRRGQQGRQDLHARPEPRPRLHRRRAAARVVLHGRSLLFLRNVGHLMTNPAILWDDGGQEIPEGIMDAVVTTTIALHDLQAPRRQRHRNSRNGSVYIVKPKMHGPAEVAFAERAVRPRRAAARPARQHRQARHHGRGAPHQRQPEGLHRRRGQPRRLHQHRLPRPHRRRDAHRHARRPDAAQGRHEEQRLDRRLRAQQRAGRPGLRPARQGADRQGHVGHARPDGRDAASRRSRHPKAGANTAWVPSPTAATLHALHYHQVDVAAVQKALEKTDADGASATRCSTAC